MSFDIWWLAYLALGAGAGFLAGLLGIGGGGMIVPILVSIFIAQGFPLESVLHLSLGSAMAVMTVTSVSSLLAHHRLGGVRWDIFSMLVPGIVLGAFGLTFIAAAVPTVPLAIFFSLFMGFTAVQMMLDVKPAPGRELPGKLAVASVGFGIGGISSLVAIGGAALSIPFMVWCNVRLQQAIGTAAAIGWPVAAAGTLGYVLNGYGQAGLPPGSFGYVYLPACVLVAAAGVLTAPIGARLAHRLPVARLKRFLALFFLMLSLKMVHSVFM